jgi:hypothetical protein
VTECNGSPVADETAKLLAYDRGVSTSEHSRGTLHDVSERPARNDTVIGEDQDTGQHAHATDQLPAAGTALFLAKQRHRRYRISATPPPDQNLGHHYRHADQYDAQKVNDYERAAPVLARDVWEFPNVAETHGRAGNCENEGHP